MAEQVKMIFAVMENEKMYDITLINTVDGQSISLDFVSTTEILDFIQLLALPRNDKICASITYERGKTYNDETQPHG